MIIETCAIVDIQTESVLNLTNFFLKNQSIIRRDLLQHS